MDTQVAPPVPTAPPVAAPVRAATTVGGYTLPPPRRTLLHVHGIWFMGLVFFGYVPALTYGKLTWLLNDHQWAWTLLMYVTLVPLVGGICVILLPCLWYRPIHDALTRWWNGGVLDRSECVRVYERILHLPWQVGMGACYASLIGYVGGTLVVHWRSNQPVVEMIKTIPAIPLVGGLMGAFCYFGTARALHPVLAWCSVHLRHARPIRRVSLAAKFLITTCVLSIAALCLLEPAAYRVGQVITEQHLLDITLGRLQIAARRAALFDRLEDQVRVLPEARVGAHGYVVVADEQGRFLTPHPLGYLTLAQEQFFQPDFDRATLGSKDGVWVDRVGQHRVVAFVRMADISHRMLSVAFPTDFSKPLRHFVQFSWLVIVEIFFVVVLFGQYFTNGVTTPLAELTRAARRVAEFGDLSQHVPVTTNDELSEVSRAFNRMVEELQSSKADLEEYTKRLEQSAQELSAVNQEMEDLLRVVSHDLRAPLINIQGFSKRLDPILQDTVSALDQLAQRSAEEDRQKVDSLKATVQTKFAESLRFIAKGVEKMDSLLSSLLAVSRVGRKADPIKPNKLDQILDDVLATFDHQLKEQAIQVIRHPLPTAVPCRANEINQVLSNLISNAINYMGATGNRFIEIGSEVRADHVECYVRDTGIGIAPDDQERVFQMFTRLQAIDVPGEGVGLAYVKKILRSHGGRIWVTSQKGQGSTFFFTLPLHEPGWAAPRQFVERAQGPSARSTTEGGG